MTSAPTNHKFLFATLALCIAGALFPAAIIAQGQQDQQSTLLPEIDPQDIEIRTEFRARFPGLRRQPILGFNPTPRVYQVDPNRTPFMETPEQIVANLPVSDLARPAPPGYRQLRYDDEINVYGRLGVGSYSSPEAEAWGIFELSEKTYAGGSVDYRSSDGHLDNRPSSFRFFEGNASLLTQLGEHTRLAVDGNIHSDFNYLIDQITAPGSFTGNFPEKNYSGARVSGELRHFRNSVEGWNAGLNYRFFETELDGPSLDETVDESIFNVSFANTWAGNHVHETFRVKVGGRGGGISFNSGDANNWYIVRGGAEYERLFNFSTRVTAGGDVYYVQDPFEDLNGESRVYIGPYIEVKHWISDMLTVKGEVSARPYFRTVKQYHESNRFFTNFVVSDFTAYRHTFSIDARGEANFEYMNGSSLHAGISYMKARDYPYYRKTVGFFGNVLDFYEVNFMDADRIRGFAGVTHQVLPEKLWLSAEIYAQEHELDDGSDIPFEEKWGFNSSIGFQPVDRINVEGRADYVGSKIANTPEGDLDGFFLVGGSIEVDITDRFGAYAKFVNLLNKDYEVWQGYTERPFQAYGGITVKFN